MKCEKCGGVKFSAFAVCQSCGEVAIPKSPIQDMINGIVAIQWHTASMNFVNYYSSNETVGPIDLIMDDMRAHKPTLPFGSISDCFKGSTTPFRLEEP